MHFFITATVQPIATVKTNTLDDLLCSRERVVVPRISSFEWLLRVVFSHWPLRLVFNGLMKSLREAYYHTR